MWLCNYPHGAVLVHGVYPSGCDGPAARHPLPHDGHHGIKRGISISTAITHSNKPFLVGMG